MMPATEIVRDSLMRDTLSCDRECLDSFMNNLDYDYDRDFSESQSLLERFWEWLDSMKDEAGDSGDSLNFENVDNIADATSTVVQIIFIALVLVALALLIYYNRRTIADWFRRRLKKKKKEEEAEADNIYAYDLETEFEQSMSVGDYDRAAKMHYMQTLRRLADASLIDWKIYKTPWQFVVELGEASFRDYTNLYLPIRYGDRPATSEVLSQMDGLSKAIDALVEEAGRNRPEADGNAARQEGGEA